MRESLRNLLVNLALAAVWMGVEIALVCAFALIAVVVVRFVLG